MLEGTLLNFRATKSHSRPSSPEPTDSRPISKIDEMALLKKVRIAPRWLCATPGTAK
jgi:hypothetical protein